MPPGADGPGFASSIQTSAQSIGTAAQIKTIDMSESQSQPLSARERLRQHVNRNIQMQQELARQQAEKQSIIHGADTECYLKFPSLMQRCSKRHSQPSCQTVGSCPGSAKSGEP